jgi:hypothetical protein
VTGGALLLFRVLAHCMELSWLAAWMIFVSAALLPDPSPLGPAILAFAGAFVLTRLSTGRGWLVLAVLALHTGGLLCASAIILHAVYAPAAPLLDKAWLLELLSAERTAGEGWALLLYLSWAVVFWRGGVRLAKRPIHHGVVCSQFDKGIAAFGLLYLIKWVAPFHGVVVDDPISHRFLFPFFASSLVAIGMTRLQGGGEKRYLPGYHSVGILLTFASATLLSATALILFLLPYLTVAAQAGFVVLKWAAVASSPFLVWVLRLLFAPHTLRANPAPPAPKLPKPEILIAESSPSWWMDFIAQLLAWPLRIALFLTVVALLCAAAYLLYRVLFSRTTSAPEKLNAQNPLRLLLAWLRRLWLRLSALGRGGSARWRAHEFYGALLTWARRNGHPRSPAETPREFAARQRRLFPALAPEIERIVDAFNQESYREVVLGGKQLMEVGAAWRRVRSPRHWPARVKGWLRR